jgi:hypothetical protein
MRYFQASDAGFRQNTLVAWILVHGGGARRWLVPISKSQAEFYRKVTEQAFVPMRQVLEGLQQAAKTTRAAGEALKEAGELLIQQAAAMDQGLSLSSPFLEVTAPVPPAQVVDEPTSQQGWLTHSRRERIAGTTPWAQPSRRLGDTQDAKARAPGREDGECQLLR